MTPLDEQSGGTPGNPVGSPWADESGVGLTPDAASPPSRARADAAEKTTQVAGGRDTREPDPMADSSEDERRALLRATIEEPRMLVMSRLAAVIDEHTEHGHTPPPYVGDDDPTSYFSSSADAEDHTRLLDPAVEPGPRVEPTVDWSVDARTVQHVHRQIQLATALAEVRGDIALLGGLDPRWARVHETLERGVNHDESLEQLLTGPLGSLVLKELKHRVDERVGDERTPARVSMRPGPKRSRPRSDTPRDDSTLPLAVAVRARFPFGVAAIAVLTFALAVAVGYGIGTLGAEVTGTPPVALPPHTYPLPPE